MDAPDTLTGPLSNRFAHAEDFCSHVNHYDNVILVGCNDSEPGKLHFKVLKSRNNTPIQFKLDLTRDNKIM